MNRNRRRILYVAEAMGGGVFTFLVGLCNELVDYYDIFVAYGIRTQTPDDFRKYFDERVHLIRVRNFERSIDPRHDIGAFVELRKIADKVKPDLIHLHSSEAGVLGRWAFDGKKIPLFYTPHGYSFLMSNYNATKRLSYKMVEKLSAIRRCTTISCSEGEHKETLSLTKNARFVNNGINVEEMQRMMDSIGSCENEEFTVFTLGRICYQKNPGLFNEIAEKLPDVRFVWIGDGELRDMITAPNIEVTGWMNREEALRRSMASDVFVLTSLWEGLPMSLLESMYMEKLCLVNDVIGSRDVIRTGVNGYVCRNADEFVSAIRAILKDPEKAAKMTAQARTDIIEKYNTRVMAEKYREIYEEAFAAKDKKEKPRRKKKKKQ
jgi:glycosyltransferase involved in cell wall biosynthesis